VWALFFSSCLYSYFVFWFVFSFFFCFSSSTLLIRIFSFFDVAASPVLDVYQSQGCSKGPKTRKRSEVSTIFALRTPLQVDRSPALINLCSVALLLPVIRAAPRLYTLSNSSPQINHQNNRKWKAQYF
ncbi:hypothetical protein, partial [Klebsiella pneumoniae]|uniref:hypothetical protein n=1 Tax=Klebsiella pneumoniae TaxID=573 RepID=UPI001F4B8440